MLLLSPIVPRYTGTPQAQPAKPTTGGCGPLGLWPRPNYSGDGQPRGCVSERGFFANLFPSTAPRYAPAPTRPALTEPTNR